MLDSISDALDPAHHHIVHNAVPAGIKRYDMLIEIIFCNIQSFFQVSKVLHLPPTHNRRTKKKNEVDCIHKLFDCLSSFNNFFDTAFVAFFYRIILVCRRFLAFAKKIPI